MRARLDSGKVLHGEQNAALESARNPQPEREEPPFLDDLTVYVVMACNQSVSAIQEIDKMQDDVDAR